MTAILATILLQSQLCAIPAAGLEDFGRLFNSTDPVEAQWMFLDFYPDDYGLNDWKNQAISI